MCVAVIVAGCSSLVAANSFGLYPAAVVAKLIASLGFIALALTIQAQASLYGRIILAGLVCSCFGDVFLLGRGDTWFLLGLGSFLLAHLSYVAAFAVHGVDLKTTAFAVPLLLVASAAAMLWLYPHIPAAMTIPVLVYVTVISLMVMLACGARGAGASLQIPLGAMMFYVSDLSVAAGQFVKPDFPNYVWGLPLYYAGQTLLAMSPATMSAGLARSTQRTVRP